MNGYLCLQGPVTFKVAVPKVPEKTEWKMSGQLITLTMPLTDTVWTVSYSFHA